MNKFPNKFSDEEDTSERFCVDFGVLVLNARDGETTCCVKSQRSTEEFERTGTEWEVVCKILNLKADLKASNGWLYRMKKKYRSTYRATTKVGRKTKPSAEDEKEEHEFMERIEEIVTLENTYVSRSINFDQTSVLLQNTGKTLSLIGGKQVIVSVIG
ncbi:hypothetical protein RvY_07055 [Ramazzottius varieornatus]|uniref:HTH CENPB-type domain-containing protein n=1 Tax=Ramazzottius varieornatus TaxID=947166 RepID=A0A1D1V6Z0_RAMVA|nr:hypothetical protein RvY_07055 [Ramazzottius varieornatus]